LAIEEAIGAVISRISAMRMGIVGIGRLPAKLNGAPIGAQHSLHYTSLHYTRLQQKKIGEECDPSGDLLRLRSRL